MATFSLYKIGDFKQEIKRDEKENLMAGVELLIA
ncbi:unnamed protein product, partial [marine sediment metagenome]